jgi:hypothetical protein
MKYRFYIADLLRGAVEGTNYGLLAHKLSRSEGCMVVDIRTSERLLDNGDRLEVGKAEDTVHRHTSYAQFRKHLSSTYSKLQEKKADCHKQGIDQ